MGFTFKYIKKEDSFEYENWFKKQCSRNAKFGNVFFGIYWLNGFLLFLMSIIVR